MKQTSLSLSRDTGGLAPCKTHAAAPSLHAMPQTPSPRSRRAHDCGGCPMGLLDDYPDGWLGLLRNPANLRTRPDGIESGAANYFQPLDGVTGAQTQQAI